MSRCFPDLGISAVEVLKRVFEGIMLLHTGGSEYPHAMHGPRKENRLMAYSRWKLEGLKGGREDLSIHGFECCVIKSLIADLLLEINTD